MEEEHSALEWLVPSQPVAIILFTLLTLLPLCIKGYLRYSWALPASAEKQALRLHRTITSRLHDLGLKRRAGETRSEFEARISSALGPQAVSTTRVINAIRFGPPDAILIEPTHLLSHRRAALDSVRAMPWWQRLKAALSPSSAFEFILGGKF